MKKNAQWFKVRFWIWFPIVIIFLIFIGLSFYAAKSHKAAWSGVRYENYEDGKIKKCLTYQAGAKLIKIEHFDREGSIVSVENFGK